MKRLLKYKDKKQDRYWWLNQSGACYDPPVYSILSEEEWDVIDNWHTSTETKFPWSGECSIPAISLLMGLISGNNISKIVQLGHCTGYSTLLMGFLLRKMSNKNSLFSIDISFQFTEYAQEWLNKASLNEYIKLHVSDSSFPHLPKLAESFLLGKPQLIFIDSSHQYTETLQELDVWYECLCPGGFILLHDISTFGMQFDQTNKGGVLKATQKWIKDHNLPALLINSFFDKHLIRDMPYRDPCGLGIIQKPA